MNNAKLIKILGLVATAVGMGATLLTDWVNEKKMEEKIDERIDEISVLQRLSFFFHSKNPPG